MLKVNELKQTLLMYGVVSTWMKNDSIQLILLFHSINSIVFFSTFISLYILAARVCVFVWV